MTIGDPLMDINRVADYLDCSVQRAREMLARDSVQPVSLPGRKRWRLSVIDAWIDGPAQRPVEKPEERRGTVKPKGKRSMLPTIQDLVRL